MKKWKLSHDDLILLQHLASNNTGILRNCAGIHCNHCPASRYATQGTGYEWSDKRCNLDKAEVMLATYMEELHNLIVEEV